MLLKSLLLKGESKLTDIKLENVTYVYSPNTPFRKEALENINITFHGGKLTGLIGHTGSGKSTLAQLLNGLLKPTSGRVLLGNCDIWEEPKNIGLIRHKVGLVFQYPEYQLFEETVYSDIAFGPKNMGLSGKDLDTVVRQAAEFVGLSSELLEKSPFELSGGQKRRVALAGVIAMEPEVLVLDEPAAGLDPRGRQEILTGIKAYQRTKNNSVILISHSMEDISEYADEIVVLKNSRILSSGSVEDVFNNAQLISSNGLALPSVTEIILELKRRGIDLKTVYTTNDAIKEIKQLLQQQFQE
ncbi:MAG: energy-coupling factor transporter ATPase [Ruminococcaceae bacterium]|nr:energy-coupling factor transporter ATPase [Oscillospiraceae bacterium]